MEERRRRKSVVKWVVVGVAIGVIVAYTILGVWMIYEDRNRSKIHLGDIRLVADYWSDSGRRANVSVRLYNKGYVDGYAKVIFFIECNGHIQDGEIKAVFVTAHSYVGVTADLDVPEPPATYGPKVIILYQWKG
jgi:hypothetical protein